MAVKNKFVRKIKYFSPTHVLTDGADTLIDQHPEQIGLDGRGLLKEAGFLRNCFIAPKS